MGLGEYVADNVRQISGFTVMKMAGTLKEDSITILGLKAHRVGD